MPALTTKQVDEMVRRGLSPERVAELASTKGFDMPDTRSYGKRVVDSFVERGKSVFESFKGIPERAAAGANLAEDMARVPLETARTFGRGAREIAGGAGDIVYEALPEGLRTGLANKTEEFLAGKNGQRLVGALAKFNTAQPEIAASTLDVLETATLGATSALEKPGLKILTKGVEGAEKATGSLGKTMVEGGRVLERRAQAKSVDAAVEATMPFFPSEANKAAEAYRSFAQKEGRVEGNRLTGFKVKPSERDLAVAESIMDVFDPKKTPFENRRPIERQIAELGRQNESVIKQHDSIFNKGQIKSYIQNSIEDADHQLLFAGEEAAKKAYDDVIETLLDVVQEGKLSGLFSGRQELDNIAQKYLEKYSKSYQLGINSINDIKTQAVIDVRRAANDYVIETIAKTNPQASKALQSSLGRQTLMFEALKRMEKNGNKVLKEGGLIDGLFSFSQRYPKISLAVGGLALVGGWKVKDIVSDPLVILTLLTGGSAYVGGRILTSQAFARGLGSILTKYGNQMTSVERDGIEALLTKIKK